MIKLFFTLFFLVVVSFKSYGSTSCVSLFVHDSLVAKELIEDLVTPKEIKKSLLRQVQYHKNIHDFSVKFINRLDQLHNERILEIFAGENHINFHALGFSSAANVRKTRELVINRAIQLLTLVNSNDITPEFIADFMSIADRVYSPTAKKADLERTIERLNMVIRSYQERY